MPLTDAEIARDSLIGTANDGSNARVAMPLQDVFMVSTREVDAGRSAALGGGIFLGLLGALTILLIAVASTADF
ncbi:MAG: hypothetical protein ACR2M1_15580 [Gemmatimonadaceae bacterium]